MQDHRALDAAAWISAGIAAVSLANAALLMTLLAASTSFVIGCIRIYQWAKGQGPLR